MLSKLHIASVLVAALSLAAVLFAPSGASAHAGHQRPQVAATQQKQPAPQMSAAPRTVAPSAAVADAEMTTAKTPPSLPSSHADCRDFGCCSNGPCTGCHGAVLISSALPAPPFLSIMLAGDDARLHAKPHDGRLRRPPKSFA